MTPMQDRLAAQAMDAAVHLDQLCALIVHINASDSPERAELLRHLKVAEIEVRRLIADLAAARSARPQA